jgi:NhaP-type Na+/H+ or K+/H+ antiporter
MNELNLIALLTVAATVLVWGVAAARLERWNVTGPIFFVAAGFVLASFHDGFGTLDARAAGIRELAEVTLAVVLFGDAASVPLRALRREAGLPLRLLGVGLPMTMAGSALAAHLLLPDMSWWTCALVGAAVAPTDAALGAAIMEDERVPSRVRRALNVESGLNDGIVTPFVSFFLVAAMSADSMVHGSRGEAIADLVLGALLGIAIGVIGGWLLARSGAASGSAPRNLGAAALGLVAYGAAVEFGANGFVAAFVAGLAYGSAERRSHESSVADTLSLTHQGGELLSFVVWFLFGVVMVPELADITWNDLVFALLALSVLRMLPVWLALRGAGFDGATVGLIGWFGPRGLASVVFALLAFDELAPVQGARVVVVITATVLASVLLHGFSAAPIAQRYANRPSKPEVGVPR